MKCQLSCLKLFNMRAFTLALLFSGVLGTCGLMKAAPNFDTIRQQIAAHLRNANPEAVITYEEHNNRLRSLLTSFLDFKNNLSLAEHVKRFENALACFKQQVVENPAYQEVRSLTASLHEQFSALVNVLRNHKPSDGASSLLTKLASYRHLLPSEIANRYSNPFTLIGSITHRLNCKSTNTTIHKAAASFIGNNTAAAAAA